MPFFMKWLPNVLCKVFDTHEKKGHNVFALMHHCEGKSIVVNCSVLVSVPPTARDWREKPERQPP